MVIENCMYLYIRTYCRFLFVFLFILGSNLGYGMAIASEKLCDYEEKAGWCDIDF